MDWPYLDFCISQFQTQPIFKLTVQLLLHRSLSLPFPRHTLAMIFDIASSLRVLSPVVSLSLPLFPTYFSTPHRLTYTSRRWSKTPSSTNRTTRITRHKPRWWRKWHPTWRGNKWRHAPPSSSSRHSVGRASTIAIRRWYKR